MAIVEEAQPDSTFSPRNFTNNRRLSVTIISKTVKTELTQPSSTSSKLAMEKATV
jgi:hypothetical protein